MIVMNNERIFMKLHIFIYLFIRFADLDTNLIHILLNQII